ncbi:unnamed protein product [Mytilus edulis]|uniref:CCHC-type domain-containing protein n=1 Tax=Mytilus edulis TaxID=6550 RepID=A0A8S3PZS7_MYTED|nr:unnamed protein product [Mytilus edulis]
MSDRKRPRRQNIDNSRNWPKETYMYLEKLKEMGIGVNATWKVEMLRQLYLANKPKTPSITIPETPNQPPVNELQNSTNTNDQEVGLYHPSTLPVVNDTRIHTPGNTPNLNSEKMSTKRIEATTPTLESAIRCSNSRQTDSAAEATSTGKVYYAEDLPKMDFVAPSIKKQIIEGRDINLATLLAPKYDIPQNQTMQSRGFTVELSSKKDVRLDHNLSIEEFNRAFRKYRNIMGKAFPQKKVELEQYEADINEISQNYGPCFYTYHKMFSAKAAAAIVEHNIVINWSKVDDKLLNLVTHNVQSRACAHCGEFDHTSKFCEKAKHGNPTLSQGATNIRNTDKRGRPVSNIAGAELCNNYNYGTCYRRECKFMHACSQCGSSGHGMKTCSLAKQQTKQPRSNNETAYKHFVMYLLNGIRFGFDTLVSMLELPTFECRNLLSAIRDPESVDMLLKQEIDKGYVKGPFSSPPFERQIFCQKNVLSLIYLLHTNMKHMKASIVL